jgi:cytochrome c-type protein NapB
MRGADVTAADTAPDLKAYSAKTPGVGEPRLITRTFVGQPPLVPHNIEKYVPLTAEENACLDCHITDELRGQKMPKMARATSRRPSRPRTAPRRWR